MAKKKSRSGNALTRAAESVRRMFSRSQQSEPKHSGDDVEQPIRSMAEVGSGRGARRDADIPLDQIANEYVPTQTSLKSGFRADGADRQRDQTYANGVADDRWGDEDRLTNKSGDPRIGTHGRSYEPGERSTAKKSHK